MRPSLLVFITIITITTTIITIIVTIVTIVITTIASLLLRSYAPPTSLDISAFLSLALALAILNVLENMTMPTTKICNRYILYFYKDLKST